MFNNDEDSDIKESVFLAKAILIALAILAFSSLSLLSSCSPKYTIVEKEVPIEIVKTEYKNSIHYDSVYIHDSINMYIKGDTIFKDKVLTIYKDKLVKDTIHITDSIDKPVYITTTEYKEVNKLNKFQKSLIWSGIIIWLILIILLARKFLPK